MRQRKNTLFLVFSLAMVIGLGRVYNFFQDYYSDRKDYIVQNKYLELEIEREKLKTALYQNRVNDLQQDVAVTITPEKLKMTNLAEYKLKQFSSAVRVPASAEGVDISSVTMEKGRQAYKNEKYALAAKHFREIVQKYPASAQVIEAQFLLGESLFQAHKFDDCLDVVYEMMNHYPQNEMTGFLMLRNAQILSNRRRNPEAAEFYRVIIRNFKSSEALRSQAEKLLKTVGA